MGNIMNFTIDNSISDKKIDIGRNSNKKEFGKINKREKRKICVIGDIMLDRYLYGKANRISPEAPIPVVLLENDSSSLGAAAYVATNLVSLKADCILIGRIGKDENGKIIKKLLKKNNIKSFLIEMRL